MRCGGEKKWAMTPIDGALSPFQTARMRPAIVTIDEDEGALLDVERELRDRYAPHYRVLCTTASHEARSCLTQLAGAGDEVALVLVGQWLSGMTGGELLEKARRLHPRARRGLLIERGGLPAGAMDVAVFGSLGHDRIDRYLLKPSALPDESFHRAISSLLSDWASGRHAPGSPERFEKLPRVRSAAGRGRGGSVGLVGPREADGEYAAWRTGWS